MTKVVSTKTKGNVTTRRYDNGSSCQTTVGLDGSCTHLYFDLEGKHTSTESISAEGVIKTRHPSVGDVDSFKYFPESSDALVRLFMKTLAEKAKPRIVLSNHGDHLSASFEKIFQREGAAKSKDAASTQSPSAS